MIAADQRRVMLPIILKILDTYSENRPTGDRKDARIPRELALLLDQLTRAQVDRDRLRQIRDLVSEIGAMYDANNRQQVARQVTAIVGVNFGGVSEAARRQLRRYIDGNVAYIKRLGDTSKAKVRDVVEDAFVRRVGPETLRERLLERVRVSESHAQLIARDQGNKFFGSLTRARHTDLGARDYVWNTSRDERVRPSHRALHGRRFAYSDPPSVGNPGEDIQCRCTGTPIFRSLEQ